MGYLACQIAFTDIFPIFIVVTLLGFITSFALFYQRKITQTVSQFLPILLGFIGGLMLNNVLSSTFLASFTQWEISTNTGSFNYAGFLENPLTISLLLTISIALLYVIFNPLKLQTNRTDKIILVCFGFSAISLVLAGFNFLSNLFGWLSMYPVALHWGDRLSINSDVIVDIIKSLFLAGFFSVIERIAKMKKQI